MSKMAKLNGDVTDVLENLDGISLINLLKKNWKNEKNSTEHSGGLNLISCFKTNF